MRNPTIPDAYLWPLLDACDKDEPDKLTPSQLFALAARGWIFMAAESDREGGASVYAALTRLGQREVELYRRRAEQPPQGLDESTPKT